MPWDVSQNCEIELTMYEFELTHCETEMTTDEFEVEMV